MTEPDGRSRIDESERFHGIGTLAGVIDRAVLSPQIPARQW
jgi:hypothetical protein